VVGKEHYDFDHDYRNQERSDLEVLQVSRDWERNDAPGKKSPRQGVNHLYDAQGLRNGRLDPANHDVQRLN
jgi:hypothetical protein